MSANNWKVCPVCQDNHDKEIQDNKSNVVESYGNIPMSEFIADYKECQTVEKLDDEMREDYDIRSEGFNLSIDYSCRCTVCQFSFKYVIEIDMARPHDYGVSC